MRVSVYVCAHTYVYVRMCVCVCDLVSMQVAFSIIEEKEFICILMIL